MRALGFQLVRSEDQVRRDPAPSRWHYRMQRVMLTPLLRFGIKVVLPVVLVTGAVALWSTTGDRQERLAAALDEALAKIQNRPEFMVAGMQVTGASPALVAAATDMIEVSFPISSWDLDLAGIRADVMALTAVRDVSVGVRPGGMLEIAVEERKPIAVWRHGDSLRLIDAEGVVTGMIPARADRADLPLIAGDGAKEAIEEAMAIFAAAGPVTPRLRGLVRMGERRWDIVLDRDQRILLPELDPVPALERVIAWQAAQELLDRDVVVVDMRDSDRPTLRLSQPAMNAMTNGVIRAAAAPGRQTGTGQ